MFEDLDIPQNFRGELLPLLEALIKLQDEVLAIASRFKPDNYYFIPSMVTLPSRFYTGQRLHAYAGRQVAHFVELVIDAGRGEHFSKDERRTVVDQLRFVIDFDYDTIRENLQGIKLAVEVESEDELKQKQEQYRNGTRERLHKELPELAKYRRSMMH